MDRIADAHAAAVVDRDPAGAAGRVEQGVEQRPVGDRVGAILHALGFAVGRGHRAGVQMVPADHDGRFDFAFAHQPVELQAHFGPLAVLEPADAGGQPLEAHFLAGFFNPAHQAFLVREGFDDGLIGDGDVVRVAREGRPAEWSGTPTEKGPDEGGHEARNAEGLLHAAMVGHLTAQVVAVVEDDGTQFLQLQHGLDVPLHGVEHGLFVAFWVFFAEGGRRLHGVAGRNVAVAQVVGGRLVGDHVGHDAPAHQLGQHVGDVAQQAHRERLAALPRPEDQFERFVEVRAHAVEVARADAALDALRIDLDAQEGGFVHGGGQWLGPAHTTQARRYHQSAFQRAAEVLARTFGERLVGALQDALGADVDPGAGRHLAVHGQAQRLQPPEFVPGGPAGDQVAVGDEHARGQFVRAEYAYRLAALHEQRLVVFQALERLDNLVEAGPVAGGLAGAAVDDEFFGFLGDLRAQVVHQHTEGGLLMPALAVQRGAARGANGDRRRLHGDRVS